MRATPAKFVFALCLLALGGCAAIHSERFDPRDTSEVRTGMHYALPKALFQIGLMERGDNLIVLVSEPIYIGDPDAAYMLEAPEPIVSDQEYLLVVHPETRLLSYVNSESEGQADQILRNIVRGVSGVGATEERGGREVVQRLLYSRIVDPFMIPGCDFGTACNLTDIAADMRQAAIAYFDCGATARESEHDLCPRLRTDSDFFSLRLSPLFDAPVPAAQTAAMARDCRVSICYRTPAPYMISLRVRGVVDVAEVVALPNEAPVSRLVVPGGVFADASARIELRNGMPGRYAVDRKSEVVAITALPFTLVREAFSTVSEVFEFRIDYSNDRRRLAEAESQRVAAEQQARRDDEDASGLRNEAAPMSDTTGALAADAASFRAAPAGGVPATPLFEIPLMPEPDAQVGGGGG